MALDPSTTSKLSDWYSTYTNAQQPANPGTGMLSAFNPGSGDFGVQNAATPNPTSPTMLSLGDLDQRTVEPGKETVAGQMTSLLDSGSSYIEGARERTARAANARGLLNSSLAASAGEDAAIQAALPIATADAGTFGKAADYNTALLNQARMYNADTGNAFASQQRGLDADWARQQAQLANQMEQARLSSETSRYATDVQAETARANNDLTLTKDAQNNAASMLNNIIQSTELSPDRKAALIRSIGPEYESYAQAIHVVSDVRNDLVPENGGPQSQYSTPGTRVGSDGRPILPNFEFAGD